MNSENFQDHHVIVVDGSRIHFAKKLEIPPRIKLLQLPHCSELNPIERVWLSLKRRLNWKNWPTSDKLKDDVMIIIDSWDELDVFNLAAYPYIREALNVIL
jgi:transposase